MLALRARVLGANNDIRVAVVGFRAQGRGHIRNYSRMQGVRIVALCDVRHANAAGVFARYPEARRSIDFREMLDEVANRYIDPPYRAG